MLSSYLLNTIKHYNTVTLQNCYIILNSFLDVVNEASIKSCFETVTKICGEAGLSCLINNSGKNNKPDAELTGLTFDKFNDIFSVNTFAPAVVSKVRLHTIKDIFL